VYNGVWGKDPEAGEFSRIFVLKVTLQSVRLLLTVSYRTNIGGVECTNCSPSNFVGGAPLIPMPMGAEKKKVLTWPGWVTEEMIGM